MCPLFQGPGDGLDGKIDEGTARLLLDSTPSKVVCNEITVCFPTAFLASWLS
jgi:cleavage and polyadenylation specificity factor subunit 2